MLMPSHRRWGGGGRLDMRTILEFGAGEISASPTVLEEAAFSSTSATATVYAGNADTGSIVTDLFSMAPPSRSSRHILISSRGECEYPTKDPSTRRGC